MKSLFISTYDDTIIIGLLSNGTLLSEKRKHSVKGHSIYLVPLIEETIKENNMKVQDLNEVIVINGPGSFTGIRLGITVAKTLAYTLNIPIKTITSIEAIGASNLIEDKLVTIKDNKGRYIGLFKGNTLKGDLIYLKEEEYQEYVKKHNEVIIEDNNINLEEVYKYTKNLTFINPHEVKAIYIKEIEALNGR